jgi:hypothetical protein
MFNPLKVKIMQKKKLSDQHKMSIKNALLGRKMPDSTKEAVIRRLKDNHHNRYEWILINPKGEIVRTKSMRSFCHDNGLSYSSLRYKLQIGDSRPILRGPSAGWVVFSAKRIKTE